MYTKWQLGIVWQYFAAGSIKVSKDSWNKNWQVEYFEGLLPATRCQELPHSPSVLSVPSAWT